MVLISLALLIVGLFNRNEALIVASGLFAISSSIDTFRFKYFKKKDE